MPLGVLALGSWLADEHVVVVDGRFELAPEARVAELAAHALCLGITVRTGPPLRDAVRVTRAARLANPRLPVLWGGPHLAGGGREGADLVLAEGATACVLGAGERALSAAVEAIHRGRGLETVPGLFTGGEDPPAAQGTPQPDRQPAARYSILDLERHFEAAGIRRLDYCSSRGSRAGGDWSGLGVERVLGEIEELAERYGLAEIAFRDEDFYAEARRADALAYGFPGAGLGLGWSAALGVDDIVDGGHDRLALLASSRCRRLSVEIRQDRLSAEGRERAMKAARLLHGAGLAARFEIVVDSPGEHHANLSAAANLARELCAVDPRFETPLRRTAALRPPTPVPASLDAWLDRWNAPWPDPQAEARLARTAFYFAEAQRTPGRRLGQHLLHLMALVRVRLGVFGFDVERRVVEASALLRTGRPRRVVHGE